MQARLLLLICLLAKIAFAQQLERLPSELSILIPKGFEVLGSAKGDINNDKLLDYVLVCKNKKEAEDSSLPRPLLLILQDTNKKYSVAKRNDNLVLCAGCGGVMGDPFLGVEISKEGNFQIQHYGGSSWRWSKDVAFRYDIAKNNWVLATEKNASFHASDPDKTTRAYSILENEFLVAKTIDNYTGEEVENSTKWVVKAEKAFFHNQANEKTIRKGYLIKGNKVETWVETKNFVWVEYPKTDEFKRGTLGFILKKDLEKLK